MNKEEGREWERQEGWKEHRDNHAYYPETRRETKSETSPRLLRKKRKNLISILYT